MATRKVAQRIVQLMAGPMDGHMCAVAHKGCIWFYSPLSHFKHVYEPHSSRNIYRHKSVSRLTQEEQLQAKALESQGYMKCIPE